jgi:molybdopterin converting factor small subunit
MLNYSNPIIFNSDTPFENDEAMKVEINLYATLARYLPASVKATGGKLDVEKGMTVEMLMHHLDIPADLVKLIFVDGIHADRNTVLKEGNRLGLFPPVGGG